MWGGVRPDGGRTVHHLLIPSPPLLTTRLPPLHTHTFPGISAGLAPSIRALDSGPVHLASADSKALLYKEVSSKHLITNALPPLPSVTLKDLAKIEKKEAKEAATARAAFDAHRVGGGGPGEGGCYERPGEGGAISS